MLPRAFRRHDLVFLGPDSIIFQAVPSAFASAVRTGHEKREAVVHVRSLRRSERVGAQVCGRIEPLRKLRAPENRSKIESWKAVQAPRDFTVLHDLHAAQVAVGYGSVAASPEDLAGATGEALPGSV